MKVDRDKFIEEGYIGPFKLNDKYKINSLLRERYIPRQLYTWQKSSHEKSAPIVRIASDQSIIDKLKQLLGNDILLWGSLLIDQKPGAKHGMHLDVEHGSWDGVTAWIGLKNLNNKTPLSLITYSHLLNTSPIELNKKNNIDNYNYQDILKEAQKLDSRCELKTFYLNPGEFIIWSGKIWHSTSNNSSNSRQSIILQYCSPNNVVKIPENFDYPNTKWSKTKPPCVSISGRDNFNYNTVLSKDSVEPSSELLRELKTLILYNGRYKLATLYNKLKKYYKHLSK